MEPLGLSCKKCGVPLTLFPGPDGTDILVHGRPWDDYDHEPEPVPTGTIANRVYVCDFCNSRNGTWHYTGHSMKAFGTALDDPLDTPLTPLPDTELDGLWVGCDGCDPFVRRNDVDGLWKRYHDSPDREKIYQYLHDDEDTQLTDPRIVAGQRQLWSQFLPTIHDRRRITFTPPPPAVKPTQLPKARDRAVTYWTNMGAGGITHDLTTAGMVMLPGFATGSEQFMAPLYDRDPGASAAIEKYIHHVVIGLQAAEMYWIGDKFTHLAVTAAKKLSDNTTRYDELPAAHGFLVWQTPILELPVANGVGIPCTGASWTLVPEGVWICGYFDPATSLATDRPAVEVRQQLGWLLPWSAGGGIAFDTENAIPEQMQFLRVLISTWLLMRQPGIADEVIEKPLKDIQRAYRKTGRPAPNVHVVNLRRTERKTRTGSQQSGERNYTSSWPVGLRTGGFWRWYWVDPGRSRRDRRWIDPYLARADLPLKTDIAPTPTVKVLK